MRKKILIFFVLLVIPAATMADDFDPLIGDWISPDGFAKLSWVREFDGSYIETRMWFQSESGWHLVGVGSAYRRPGENAWRVVSRTRDMDGIELFESTIARGPERSYQVANVAYLSDGATLKTEEEWHFDSPDSFNYTIFKTEDGQRVPWMKGAWVRIEDGD